MKSVLFFRCCWFLRIQHAAHLEFPESSSTRVLPEASSKPVKWGLAARYIPHNLDSGKVLIAGGFSSDRQSLASTEIYDPATKDFSFGPSMITARQSHSATRLPDGRILIAGGFDGDYLDNAEIYDPKTNRFSSTGKLGTPSGHQAVLLNNGKVLLAGGVGTGWTFLASAEIFDPRTNTFSATGSMTTPRESHTATLLSNGQVLIAGGHQGRRSEMRSTRPQNCTSEKGAFSAGPNLNVRRHKHDAVTLHDGRVLIAGGADERDSRGAYKSTEVYDPVSKSFQAIADMNLARYKLQGTSVLLKDGDVRRLRPSRSLQTIEQYVQNCRR